MRGGVWGGIGVSRCCCRLQARHPRRGWLVRGRSEACGDVACLNGSCVCGEVFSRVPVAAGAALNGCVRRAHEANVLVGVNFLGISLSHGGGMRTMQEGAKHNFILQQGFEEPAAEVCPRQYSALHFQPRTIFLWVLAGIWFQSAPLFYVLCAVLWWSALLPRLNPFDAVYNWTFGRRA